VYRAPTTPALVVARALAGALACLVAKLRQSFRALLHECKKRRFHRCFCACTAATKTHAQSIFRGASSAGIALTNRAREPESPVKKNFADKGARRASATDSDANRANRRQVIRFRRRARGAFASKISELQSRFSLADDVGRRLRSERHRDAVKSPSPARLKCRACRARARSPCWDWPCRRMPSSPDPRTSRPPPA